MKTEEREKILTSKGYFEECTGKEWDKLMEGERDFIDFGNGFTYARKEKHHHILKISSLHDAQLNCSCGWSLVSTGLMTKEEAMEHHELHKNQEYKT